MDQDASAIVAITNLPRTGTLIDRTYRIVEELGRGSFGVVYEAEQLPLERRVAIKMLKPQAVLLPGVQERFLREARLVSALTSRHTVTVFGFGVYTPRPQLNGLPYFIMERLQGEGLDSYLQRVPRIPPNETLQILRQILLSLSEAHERGIIHRDIKPENIFLGEQDGERVVKVLDFGIARAVGGDWSEETRQRLTRTGIICGTPAFMAPEQATGAPEITPTADLYSVGCIAYLMLTGRLPYPGYSPTAMAYGHLSDPIPGLPTPLDRTPIAAVLRQAMAKAPSQRFRTAQEFIRELDDCLDANPEIFGPDAPDIDVETVPSTASLQADTLQVGLLITPTDAPEPALSPALPQPTELTPPPLLIQEAPITAALPALPAASPTLRAQPAELAVNATRRTTVIVQRNAWGGAIPALLIFVGGLVVAGVILYLGLFRESASEMDTTTAVTVAPETLAAQPTPRVEQPPLDALPSEPEPTQELAARGPEKGEAPSPDEEPASEAPRPAPHAPARQPAKKSARQAPASAAAPKPTGKSAKGELLIVCAQPDLVVFIDGSGPYGCGRVASFPPGDYAVRAHARGQEIRRVVHLKPGAQQRVSLNIE